MGAKAAPKAGKEGQGPNNFRLVPHDGPQDGLTGYQRQRLAQLAERGETKRKLEDQRQRFLDDNKKNANPKARAQTAAMMGRLEDTSKPHKSEWYRPLNLAGERSTNTSNSGVHDGFAAINDAGWRRAADWARTGNRKAFDAARAATKPGSRERMMLERGWSTTTANQKNATWVADMKRRGVITKMLRAYRSR